MDNKEITVNDKDKYHKAVNNIIFRQSNKEDLKIAQDTLYKLNKGNH